MKMAIGGKAFDEIFGVEMAKKVSKVQNMLICKSKP